MNKRMTERGKLLFLNERIRENPDPALVERRDLISAWIEQAPTEELRLILEGRLLCDLTWFKIGRLTYRDGSAARRKYLRYVKNHPCP